MSTRAFIIAMAMGILAGCAGPKETAKPSAGTDEELKKYEAEFRPSDYDPDPGRKPGLTGTETEDVPDTTALGPATAPGLELVAGFRVQLMATTSIDEANAKKTEAEGLFPGEWIYIEYDPPSYKVRAGNFQSRVEADRFAKLASSHGFQDAWPVPERVYKQTPPPQKVPAEPEVEK